MKIGIDTSRTADKKTGLERYADNLIRALAAIDRQNQYILYPFFWHCFPENPGKAVNPRKRNFKIRKFWTPSLTRKAWEAGRIARKKILGGDVDIIHSPFYTVPEEYLGKIIVTVHDLSFIRYPEFHTPENREFCFRQLEKIKKQADCVITVSEFSKKELMEIGGIDERRIRVIHEAAAPIFKPAKGKNKFKKILKKFGIHKKFILYAGSIEPRKNLKILIRALAQVLENKIDCVLVLAGGTSWLTTELKEEISNLGLGDKVIFTGYVTDEELLGLYNLAQVFVYPSIYEGFGLPVLEALASGCPVIASNTSSLPEIVGDAALLIEPEDFGDLAEKITRVFLDNDLRQKLIQKGLTQSQKFSWEKTAKKTLEVYQEVYQNGPNLSDSIIIGIEERGLGEGWFGLEKTENFYFRWTKRSARLYLKIINSVKDYILNINACSNFSGDGFQDLKIFANGKKIAKQKLKYGWHIYSYKFSLNQSSDKVKIDLKINKTLAPRQISPDKRKLGIIVREVTIKPKEKVIGQENQLFPYPRYLEIETTTLCNMNPPCVMCGRSCGGIFLHSFDEKNIGKIDFLFKNAKHVSLHGCGEPLMQEKLLFSFIERFPSDTFLLFNSNGILLTEKNIMKLIEYRLNLINISIDAACPETYKKIRRHDYFDNIKNNLKLLSQIKKNNLVNFPLVIINMVIIKENLQEVVDFVRLAKEVDACGVEFYLLNQLPKNYVVKTDLFYFDYDEQIVDTSSPKFINIIRSAQKLCKNLKISFITNRRDILQAISDVPLQETSVSGKYFCRKPWENLFIEANGGLKICCHFKDHLGNLDTNNFYETWKSEKMKKVRKAISQGLLPEECHGCPVAKPRSPIDAECEAELKMVKRNFVNLNNDIKFVLEIVNRGEMSWKEERQFLKGIWVGCRIYSIDRKLKNTFPLPITLKQRLPSDIKKGESFQTVFIVRREWLVKGKYKVKFDLIQARNFWFEDMGSLPLVEYLEL